MCQCLCHQKFTSSAFLAGSGVGGTHVSCDALAAKIQCQTRGASARTCYVSIRAHFLNFFLNAEWDSTTYYNSNYSYVETSYKYVGVCQTYLHLHEKWKYLSVLRQKINRCQYSHRCCVNVSVVAGVYRRYIITILPFCHSTIPPFHHFAILPSAILPFCHSPIPEEWTTNIYINIAGYILSWMFVCPCVEEPQDKYKNNNHCQWVCNCKNNVHLTIGLLRIWCIHQIWLLRKAVHFYPT